MIKIRAVLPTDESLVSDWLARDEIHRSLDYTWDHLLEKDTTSAIVFDESDIPLLAVRFHKAIRVGMQFNVDQPYRVAKHMREVVAAMQEYAKQNNAKEIIIRPGGKAIRLAEDLGFKDFTGSKIIEV